MDYDLAIVGSGGGAFAAAIAARRLGLRVAMIERHIVGGTCVNVGCIPSKALLAASEARHRARFPGITAEAGPVDFPALIAGKRELVERMRQEKYVELAAEYGFELLPGDATFVDGPALDIDGRCIEAAHYLVATGAEPLIPDIPGLADGEYLTSTTAREEPELAARLRDVFATDGIAVVEHTVPTEVRRDGDEVVVRAGGHDFRADQLLVATGRHPRTDGLGLEAVGVEVGPEAELVVDTDMNTGDPRIWGAGDVTGPPQYVYVAAKQGSIAVANAFEHAERRIDYSAMPRITFTSPTMASAGLTEAEARERGIECEGRVLDLEHVPRAIVSRNPRGLVKLVAERDSGRLLGVHLLAEGAGDVILAGVYAIESERTINDLADSWNPYLTIGEAIHLAALSFTRDPTRLSCCAA